MWLLPLALPEAMTAQVIIPDEVACGACEIRLERVLTLRSDTPEAGVQRVPRNLYRDRAGRFYAVPWSGDRVLVFNPDGTFARDFAPKGLGPGEILGATVAQPVGDSIFVFDFRTTRLTVFDLDGEAQRSIPVQGLVAHAYPRRGAVRTWVLNGDFPGGDAIGYPLHTFDATDREARMLHYGSDGTYLPGVVGGGIERTTAPSLRTDAVWSAPWRNYAIEEWTTNGELVSQVIRPADWYPANWPMAMPEKGKERPPIVAALREVEPRRLLTVINRSGPNYHDVVKCFQERGRLVCGADTGEGAFVSRLELLDIDAGELVARLDSDQEIWGFLDDDTAWSFRFGSGGLPFIEIWRVTYPRKRE
jgi:hypothetical protein